MARISELWSARSISHAQQVLICHLTDRATPCASHSARPCCTSLLCALAQEVPVGHSTLHAAPCGCPHHARCGCCKWGADSRRLLQLPTVEEIESLSQAKKLTTIVFFLDETFEELQYDVTTTVLEAVEQLAGIIKLQNYTTFTLFECRR
jgi:hypothetical protein